jgi:hypothetical protein
VSPKGRSRSVDESGSDKTIAAVNTSIELSADIPADLDLGPSLMARWRRQAHAAIARLADSGEEFTVDTLIGSSAGPRSRANSAAFSQRRSGAADGRLVRVWRGVRDEG